MATNIGWAQNPDGTKGEVWNPTTGCTKVSAGCQHCYAESVAERFWDGRPFTDVQCHPERLDIPLRWKKPRTVFVDSMSDLFHKDVPFEFIAAVFAVMGLASRHTFLILTKRPRRMQSFWKVRKLLGSKPLPNVWLGVSAENQETADERIPLLLATPAAVRFVSFEPLLGDIWLCVCGKRAGSAYDGTRADCPLHGAHPIGWVIIGAESGAKRRPMEIYWMLHLIEQATGAGVPVFVKQDGAFRPGQQGRIPDDLWALKQFPEAVT